jgi:hypothetical protein
MLEQSKHGTFCQQAGSQHGLQWLQAPSAKLVNIVSDDMMVGCTFAGCPAPRGISLLAEASSPAAGVGAVPWRFLLLLDAAPALVR